MKTIIGLLCAVLLVAGCAHDRGGTSDDYYKGYGTRISQTNTASPTIRPELNPTDPRDPSGFTVPLRVPPS